MQPPLPSATPTWRNDTYAAISPLRPELRAAGKTVIIVGAGSGIGRETAKAFASASAERLVLLGRNEAALSETAESLPATVKSFVHTVDVTLESALQDTAASIGIWDVLILSAGYVSKPHMVADSATDEWWQCFEYTNVKGSFLAIKAFLPTAHPNHAGILGVTTGTTAMPAAHLPGLSAYMASKLAQTKLFEFVAAEYPKIFTATVHPGMVETTIFSKSGAEADRLPMDTVQLPAHFMVWLCSPEGAFLKGRTVWANWDVEELKHKATEICSGMQMTSGINGWPYTPAV